MYKKLKLFVPRFVLLSLFLVPHISYATRAERVTSCLLDARAPVEVYRASRIADTHIYGYSFKKGDLRLIYTSEEDSRGLGVKHQCVGGAERVLILSGEFSSNYIQGVVLRYNKRNGQLEKLDFSERERPQYLYVNDDGISVVLPNSPDRGAARYIVYTLKSSNGREVMREVTDVLPVEGQRYRLRK